MLWSIFQIEVLRNQSNTVLVYHYFLDRYKNWEKKLRINLKIRYPNTDKITISILMNHYRLLAGKIDPRSIFGFVIDDSCSIADKKKIQNSFNLFCYAHLVCLFLNLTLRSWILQRPRLRHPRSLCQRVILIQLPNILTALPLGSRYVNVNCSPHTRTIDTKV